MILYDYTATRGRAGPEASLKGYRGHLQADAYGGYDAFFKDPARGLTEVACWAHARRYFHKALESDQARMGPALLLIAQLYRVEQRARGMSSQQRLRLRQRHSQAFWSNCTITWRRSNPKCCPRVRRGGRCATR